MQYLTKILWATVFSLLLFAQSGFSKTRYDYNLGLGFRVGQRVFNDSGTSSLRSDVIYEQRAVYSPEWSTSVGARGELEAVYWVRKNEYSEEARKDVFVPWVADTFVRYKTSPWRVTAGWQQIVWGETFGNNISDIVNPKDFREMGLEEPSRFRRSTLALNLEWIRIKQTLQLILLPFSESDWTPKSGGEFTGVYNRIAQVGPFGLRVHSGEVSNSLESGARYSHQFGGLDLAVFYFNYVDRAPIYETGGFALPGPVLILNEKRKSLQTAGVTSTFTVGDSILRTEIVHSFNRAVNTIESGTLTFRTVDDLNYILGWDINSIDPWVFNIQWSESRLQKSYSFIRDKNVSRLDLRAARTFAKKIDSELMLSLYTNDGSELLQWKLQMPVSRRWVIGSEVDYFAGRDDSFWGRVKNASRVLLTVKGTFND